MWSAVRLAVSVRVVCGAVGSECACVQPVLGIRSRSELGKLLKRYNNERLGGVIMSDVKEALPKPEKPVKASVAGSMWMCVCACELRDASPQMFTPYLSNT